MRRTLLFIIVISLALTSSGCVYRKLTIKSDPPGATVYFNDKNIGKTPLEFDFMYYENHKMRLEKEGYETLETRELIKCPPQLWFPVDLIMELLPERTEDFREFHYKLVPESAGEEPAQ